MAKPPKSNNDNTSPEYDRAKERFEKNIPERKVRDMEDKSRREGIVKPVDKDPKK